MAFLKGTIPVFAMAFRGQSALGSQQRGPKKLQPGYFSGLLSSQFHPSAWPEHPAKY
jgi:hypothetical protein